MVVEEVSPMGGRAQKSEKLNAFTLIEMLIVISIIGILAVVTITVINPARYQKRARDTRRGSDLRVIQSAVEMYYSENGTYPDSGAFSFGSEWSEGGITYLKKVPQDPRYAADPAQTYCYGKVGSGYVLCAKPELTISGGIAASCGGISYDHCVENPF